MQKKIIQWNNHSKIICLIHENRKVSQDQKKIKHQGKFQMSWPKKERENDEIFVLKNKSKKRSNVPKT